MKKWEIFNTAFSLIAAAASILSLGMTVALLLR